MEKGTNVYRKLQKHLDNMPVGFPESKTGLDIKLLKHLFTQEEAAIALYLNAFPEPLAKIYKRNNDKAIPIAHFEKMLDNLVKKGAIMGGKMFSDSKENKHYSKAQLAIGIFEFQVDKITKEFAEDFYKYGDEVFAKEFITKKTTQMRTVPVNKSINAEYCVGSYDDINALVNNTKGPIAVINCVCRQAKDKMEDPCKKTDIRETCFIFDKPAEYFIRNKQGRKISKEEALELFEKAEKTGLVLQPENTQKPKFICCCCGCCCAVLTAAKKFPKPATFLHTNYYVEIDVEKCTGCKICEKRCNMQAIELAESLAVVDLDRCIGCGLCISSCKTNAISLKKKIKKTIPPKNQFSLYNKITHEKFGPLGTMKIIGKKVMGKKI